MPIYEPLLRLPSNAVNGYTNIQCLQNASLEKAPSPPKLFELLDHFNMANKSIGQPSSLLISDSQRTGDHLSRLIRHFPLNLSGNVRKLAEKDDLFTWKVLLGNRASMASRTSFSFSAEMMFFNALPILGWTFSSWNLNRFKRLPFCRLPSQPWKPRSLLSERSSLEKRKACLFIKEHSRDIKPKALLSFHSRTS